MQIDYDSCNSCGICYQICPMDCLRETGGLIHIAYQKDCMSCYLCEIHCPKNAIHVSPWRAKEVPLLY